MKTVIQTAGSTPEKDWDGLPYYSMNTWLKQLFGTKAYKLSLDGGPCRINEKMFNFDWGLRWLPRRFRTLKKICAALPVRTYHPARLFHFRSGSMPFHMPRPGKSVPVPGLGLCHCFRVSTV